MSPLHVAPPGPPQNFKTQVLSDTEILLTWSNVLLLADILAVYEICFNALTPMCVDDSPVSGILAELHLSIFDTVLCVCVCVLCVLCVCCVCVCVCVCVACVYIHACMYICMYVMYMCVYVHTYAHMHVCIYTHAYDACRSP